MSQWIYGTTVAPLVGAPAASELFGGSLGGKTKAGQKADRTLHRLESSEKKNHLHEECRAEDFGPRSNSFSKIKVVCRFSRRRGLSAISSQKGLMLQELHRKGQWWCWWCYRFPRKVHQQFIINSALSQYHPHLLHFDHCLVALRQVFGQVLQLRCLLLCRRIPSGQVPSVWIQHL